MFMTKRIANIFKSFVLMACTKNKYANIKQILSKIWWKEKLRNFTQTGSINHYYSGILLILYT